MRCFIDSNILISAGLFPDSVPASALRKAISMQNTAIVCDYSLDEVHRVISKEFPNRVNELESFLYRLLFTVEFITALANSVKEESSVRDVNDWPILRAAIIANADVLITGDKDLLESGITTPRIITPADFMKL